MPKPKDPIVTGMQNIQREVFKTLLDNCMSPEERRLINALVRSSLVIQSGKVVSITFSLSTEAREVVETLDRLRLTRLPGTSPHVPAQERGP